MISELSPAAAVIDLPGRWQVAKRWQAYDAEARANLLRTIAVGAFYVIHLWSYWSAQGKLPNWGFLQIAAAGEIQQRYHVIVTLLAVAWTMVALGVLICLQQRVFPQWLSFLTTACDIVLLASVLCVSAGGSSPLVAGFFLIMVLAALRLDLNLIWFATIACAAAYLFVLGFDKWSPHLEGMADAARVPRYHQIIVLLAIVLEGVMLGQIVRRMWRLADEVAERGGAGAAVRS